MNEVLTIVEILFFAAMIVLAVYLITSIRKITDSVKVIETEVKEVSDGLTPLISETSLVINDLAEVTENIKQDYIKAKPAIENVITKVKDIGDTLGKVKDGTMQIGKYVFPVLSGVSTALKFLKK